MKHTYSSYASLLAISSLAFVLGACDKGDSKDSSGAAAPVPIKKKDKAAGGGADAGNPQPPESNEAPKGMAEAPPAPPSLESVATSEKFTQLDTINAAVKSFKAKQSGQAAMMASGKSIEELKRMGKPPGSTPLTSLDQLVKAGMLKSIPEPPAGKKYVIDPKTQEVKLENR